MKHLVCALAIIVSAFMIGCQDTDTIVNAPEALTSPAKVSFRSVPLSTTIREPGELDSYVRIRGEVRYSLRLVPHDPIPSQPQWTAIIDLDVYATFAETWGMGEGLVRTSRHREIPLRRASGGSGTVTVGFWKGRYTIQGLGDRLNLELRYRVTRKGIQVTDVSLLPVGATNEE